MSIKTGSLETLRENLINVHGDKGALWWVELPEQLRLLAQDHSLTLLTPFPDLSFNYVLPVIGPHQEPWVLKCGVPTEEFTAEVNALAHYNGSGAVSLIKADPSAGWMIIERCNPGDRLVDITNENTVIPIAVEVMRKLWKPVSDSSSFPSLTQFLQSLQKLNNNDFLKNLLSSPIRHFALGRTQELLTSMSDQVLLHADLHHYNILRHRDQWIAIDPKGVIGEREFEIGAFLRNPLNVVEGPRESREIAKNLDQIVEVTCFDRQKVLSWCIIQAVLCVCWYKDDNLEVKARQLAAYAERIYNLQ